jgi:hypothetical protein
VLVNDEPRTGEVAFGYGKENTKVGRLLQVLQHNLGKNHLRV